jgi:hypothetical protein
LSPPTPEQLLKIQSLGSAALPQVSSDDLEIIPFIATDNLVARSLTKWALPALDTIAKLLPGLPFQLNHNWSEIGTITGLVFEAKVLALNQIPAELLQYPHNDHIFQTEGYYPIIAHIAFPKTSTLLAGIQLGALTTVSIGGFKPTAYHCPWCNVPFDDPECPHVPPAWWRDDSTYTAPYIIRADTSDLGELSLVTIPDVPGAKTILNKYKDLYVY